MAQATGLVMIKRMDYRDNPNEEWSNKYWLTGTPPADAAAWQALFTAMISLEVPCFVPAVKIVGAIGYNDDDPHAQSVWSYDTDTQGGTYSGTLVSAAGHNVAGDQAAFLWVKTGRKNSRGKWIYLRKYFHGGIVQTADHDKPVQEWTDALNTLAGHLHGGTGGLQGRQLRSQHQIEVLTDHGSGEWVTTRTLKRRGKRPLKKPAPGAA